MYVSDLMAALRLLLEVLGLLLLGLLFGQCAYGVCCQLFSSEGAFASGVALSANARELIALGASNLSLFLLPLLALPAARRYVLAAVRRARWQGEPWGRIALLSLALVLITYPLVYLSEWAVGLLPATWGIGVEDAVAEELEHLLLVGRWYELPLLLTSLAIVPALAEELCFRAYLQRRLIRLAPRAYWIAIFVVSVVFSLMHGSVVGFLPRLFLSLGMGYAYYLRGNVAVPIFIHALNNLVTLAVSLQFATAV